MKINICQINSLLANPMLNSPVYLYPGIKLTIRYREGVDVDLICNSETELTVESNFDSVSLDKGKGEVSLKEQIVKLSSKEQSDLYKFMYNALRCRI